MKSIAKDLCGHQPQCALFAVVVFGRERGPFEVDEKRQPQVPSQIFTKPDRGSPPEAPGWLQGLDARFHTRSFWAEIAPAAGLHTARLRRTWSWPYAKRGLAHRRLGRQKPHQGLAFAAIRHDGQLMRAPGILSSFPLLFCRSTWMNR